MIYISKIFTHLKGGIYMPGFTTHYILGMKAYNDMPQNNLKFIIAKYRWLYQLGLQGPDMFFYNLPILRHRDHRNIGSYMHEHHVNDFSAVPSPAFQRSNPDSSVRKALLFCAVLSAIILVILSATLMFMAASTMTQSIPLLPVTAYTPNWKMTLMPCY